MSLLGNNCRTPKKQKTKLKIGDQNTTPGHYNNKRSKMRRNINQITLTTHGTPLENKSDREECKHWVCPSPEKKNKKTKNYLFTCAFNAQKSSCNGQTSTQEKGGRGRDKQYPLLFPLHYYSNGLCSLFFCQRRDKKKKHVHGKTKTKNTKQKNRISDGGASAARNAPPHFHCTGTCRGQAAHSRHGQRPFCAIATSWYEIKI